MRTLKAWSSAALKVRDSRFLSHAGPVGSEAAARQAIERIGAEHPDARHCCFAYRIGAGEAAIERAHDAGEPAGSAGGPILSVLQGRELSDSLVVVVRYFGGTKLGIGGLIRAYRDAARTAIEAAATEEREERASMTFAIALEQAGEARALLARFGGVLLAERYADRAELSVEIPADQAAAFRTRVNDLTRGTARWRTPEPAGGP